MASVVGSLVGEKGYLADFFVSAAVVARQVLVREATASNTGEVADPAGTGSGGLTDVVDMVGIAQDAATQDTTPATDPRYDYGGRMLQEAAGGLENLVRVEINPFAIYRFPISGAATAGTVLVGTTTTPAHILTQDTADTTAPFGLITETAVGTISMVGGLLKGRTGNNAGAIRKITAHSNNTSTTCAMGFINSIPVNDTFIRVPYSREVTGMQMTTNFVEANGIIAAMTAAPGTLGPWRVVAVHINEVRDLAYVDVVCLDHMFNPTTP